MKLLTLPCWLISMSLLAQTNREMNSLKFMAGTWRTPHAWGDMEEIWSEPTHGNMMGSFRCIKDGKIVFYEFMVIEQRDSATVFKLRHFSPGSIAWEDKESPYLYPMVSLSATTATFERPDGETRITYALVTPNQLKSTLERKEKDGTWRVDTFLYEKVN